MGKGPLVLLINVPVTSVSWIVVGRLGERARRLSRLAIDAVRKVFGLTRPE